MTVSRSSTIVHDVKREARRRLIVGLSGLAVMLLLVILASWLTGAARREADLAKAQAQAAGVQNPGGSPSDGGPLADLGVTPTLEASDKPSVPNAATPIPRGSGDGVVVPDLQPDPQIEAPKARR